MKRRGFKRLQQLAPTPVIHVESFPSISDEESEKDVNLAATSVTLFLKLTDLPQNCDVSKP